MSNLLIGDDAELYLFNYINVCIELIAENIFCQYPQKHAIVVKMFIKFLQN